MKLVVRSRMLEQRRDYSSSHHDRSHGFNPNRKVQQIPITVKCLRLYSLYHLVHVLQRVELGLVTKGDIRELVTPCLFVFKKEIESNLLIKIDF
mmetsp:Transcript_21981/g.41241  ORF Transcript_21981/g.41241 Transcript_21981/m.41241 type:complete len:94 (+) Transcript_21981:60-341(+)